MAADRSSARYRARRPDDDALRAGHQRLSQRCGIARHLRLKADMAAFIDHADAGHLQRNIKAGVKLGHWASPSLRSTGRIAPTVGEPKPRLPHLNEHLFFSMNHARAIRLHVPLLDASGPILRDSGEGRQGVSMPHRPGGAERKCDLRNPETNRSPIRTSSASVPPHSRLSPCQSRAARNTMRLHLPTPPQAEHLSLGSRSFGSSPVRHVVYPQAPLWGGSYAFATFLRR